MFERENEKLKQIQESLNYNFNDEDLLKKALTTPMLGKEEGIPHYEVLETLGDAVIKTILISKKMEEGEEVLDPEIITKTKQAIENNDTLAKIAHKYFNLEKFIFKAKNQDLLGKENKILADVFEALCGAIFFESKDLKLVDEKIIQRFYKDWNSLMDVSIFYKSQLNEYLQKKYRFNPEIKYQYESIGPEDNIYWIAKNPKILGQNKETLHDFNLKSKPFKTQKKAERYLSPKILKLLKGE